MTPTVGRIVHYRMPIEMNGTNVAPAIVTQVLGTSGGRQALNLTVFPPNSGTFQARASVPEASPDDPDETNVWLWPPRPEEEPLAEGETEAAA